MRNDEKVLAVRRKFGFQGYSVWVMCLERLYGGDNFQIVIKSKIAWELLSGDFLVEPILLKKILCYFVSIDLLQKKGNVYYSKEVNRRVQPILDERERGREYVNRRWKQYTNGVIGVDNNTNKELSVSETIQSKVKESKVKESRVNKTKNIEIPPLLEEVKKYCTERNNGVDYEKWFNFYSAKGWLIGKNKMKDWKAAVRTWEDNKKDKRVYLNNH